jgi:hypothetical protein
MNVWVLATIIIKPYKSRFSIFPTFSNKYTHVYFLKAKWLTNMNNVIVNQYTISTMVCVISSSK